MSKKAKITQINICVILLLIIAAAFIPLLGIRNEFNRYLEATYPGLSFKVGLTKIDIIYGKYYSSVTSLSDGTVFTISRNFETHEIRESYLQYKSRDQYNKKIAGLFAGTDIKNSIKKVTGDSKLPFSDTAAYEQINVRLTDEDDYIPVVKKVLELLARENISSELIIFTYEKDKDIYELHLSSDDYNLSEKDIRLKIKRIK
jgi:hypothetical protein